jgi:putative ABC transport system substrate-binding protein
LGLCPDHRRLLEPRDGGKGSAFVRGFAHGAVIAALAAVLLSDPPTAGAQAPRVYRIGILTDAMVPWHSSTEGFRDGLRALGYVQGSNVIFETRAAQADMSRVPALAAELIRLKPDLLLCVSDACRRETTQVPIVFTQVSDPVRLGLVDSIARPGGNVTGIANLRADLTAKRLDLFKETVPSLRRVLVTYDPRRIEEQEAVTAARAAAKRLGLTLLEHPISSPLEIEPALASLEEGGRDGILIVQAGTNLNFPGRSLEVATSNNLPTMYPASFWSTFGALVSYGPDQYAQGKQAARLAHKILTGTPPAQLPVELADLIEFVVNLKTAKRLGLQVPASVLLRADRTIR